MTDNSVFLNYKFTESALKKLTSLELDPRTCLDSRFGISLRNFGPEVTILGRNKFTAFGENFIDIPVGIQVVPPEGHYVTLAETKGINHTSLFARSVVQHEISEEELTVSFFNMGEKDIVIPEMAFLPACLVAVPYCKKNKLISDLEYLDSQKQNRE